MGKCLPRQRYEPQLVDYWEGGGGMGARIPEFHDIYIIR